VGNLVLEFCYGKCVWDSFSRKLELLNFIGQKTKVKPRMTSLPTVGIGWISLLRNIEAVSLFRNGFSELIRPRRANAICYSRWGTNPKDGYCIPTMPRFGGTFQSTYSVGALAAAAAE